MEKQNQHIDCLVLQIDRSLLPTFNWLYEQGIMLPVVICENEPEETIKFASIEPNLLFDAAKSDGNLSQKAIYMYHPGEVHLPVTHIQHIESYIEQAIANFLKLTPNYQPPLPESSITHTPEHVHNLLTQQQHRLAEKLKERLGYLGVYYKRNPQYFFRHLSATDKQQFLDNLSKDYRQIILTYFTNDDLLNERIDNFVNTVFFADMPVAQVVEIHMELMDQFSKQLKLEGRNEDILLDYRLTLIDIISHLCEMYRRSIPRNS